jgi:hypothetical protein
MQTKKVKAKKPQHNAHVVAYHAHMLSAAMAEANAVYYPTYTSKEIVRW